MYLTLHLGFNILKREAFQKLQAKIQIIRLLRLYYKRYRIVKFKL